MRVTCNVTCSTQEYTELSEPNSRPNDHLLANGDSVIIAIPAFENCLKVELA